MPGGTNLPILLGLGCGSQTPDPYDAYPLSESWVASTDFDDSVTINDALVVSVGTEGVMGIDIALSEPGGKQARVVALMTLAGLFGAARRRHSPRSARS
jgi:hypothetical protein